DKRVSLRSCDAWRYSGKRNMHASIGDRRAPAATTAAAGARAERSLPADHVVHGSTMRSVVQKCSMVCCSPEH
ncbi:TPA: hypothetical protein ACVAAY_006920, partial [Burkholderia contaminans]